MKKAFVHPTIRQVNIKEHLLFETSIVKGDGKVSQDKINNGEYSIDAKGTQYFFD